MNRNLSEIKRQKIVLDYTGRRIKFARVSISILETFSQNFELLELFLKYCQSISSNLVKWTQLVSADFPFRISRHFTTPQPRGLFLSCFFVEKSRSNVCEKYWLTTDCSGDWACSGEVHRAEAATRVIRVGPNDGGRKYRGPLFPPDRPYNFEYIHVEGVTAPTGRYASIPTGSTSVPCLFCSKCVPHPSCSVCILCLFC